MITYSSRALLLILLPCMLRAANPQQAIDSCDRAMEAVREAAIHLPLSTRREKFVAARLACKAEPSRIAEAAALTFHETGTPLGAQDVAESFDSAVEGTLTGRYKRGQKSKFMAGSPNPYAATPMPQREQGGGDGWTAALQIGMAVLGAKAAVDGNVNGALNIRQAQGMIDSALETNNSDSSGIYLALAEQQRLVNDQKSRAHAQAMRESEEARIARDLGRADISTPTPAPESEIPQASIPAWKIESNSPQSPRPSRGNGGKCMPVDINHRPCLSAREYISDQGKRMIEFKNICARSFWVNLDYLNNSLSDSGGGGGGPVSAGGSNTFSYGTGTPGGWHLQSGSCD